MLKLLSMQSLWPILGVLIMMSIEMLNRIESSHKKEFKPKRLELQLS